MRQILIIFVIILLVPAIAGAQELVDAIPDHGEQGDIDLEVTVTGFGTDFGQGTSINVTAMFLENEGQQINADSLQATLPSVLTGQFDLPATAAIALWDVKVVTNNNGTLTLTDGFSINPAAPSDLTAVVDSDVRIDLGWTNNASGHQGFRIERKENNGQDLFEQIGTVGSDAVAYEDTGLTPNTSYCYQIRAYKPGFNSSYSGEACESTLAATPVVSIADAEWNETDTGSSTLQFTVTLSVASEQTVTMHYHTEDGTAQAGLDYLGVSDAVLTFTPGGTTEETIGIVLYGDELDEQNETFLLILTDPVNAEIGDGQAQCVIIDNDSPPTATIADAAATEGSNVLFTVTLSEISSLIVTLEYETQDQSATAGSDYTSIAQSTMTFQPGDTEKTISVATINDLLDEDNETFFINLSAPVNATIPDNQAQGQINDNDDPPEVSIDDVIVQENALTADFELSLSTASGRSVSVDYELVQGTATEDDDYTPPETQTLVFQPGETSGTLSIPVIDDLLDEDDETFFVDLSDPVNVTISDNQGQCEIIDNDAMPTFSIEDAQVIENDVGSIQINVTASLSAASGRSVSVNYATADVSAEGGNDYEIIPESTLEFSEGQTTGNVAVTIFSDQIDEDDETFSLNLTNPINALPNDMQSEIRIIDNDPTPTLSIEDVQINEGDTDAVQIDVTLSLSAASGRSISVNYATADGSATGGIDYETISESTMEFTAGQRTRDVTLAIYSDLLDEDDENFFLNLTDPVNVLLDDTQSEILIIDNDSSPAATIADVGVTEGSNVLFTVSLSGTSNQVVTLEYETQDQSATAGSDYTSIAQSTLTFQPGETEKTILVATIDDLLDEDSETFFVNLSTPVNATISDNQAQGQIDDNDDPPEVSIDDITVQEGDAAASTAEFELSLSAASGLSISIDYELVPGTATEGDDYTPPETQTLVFQPGETSGTLSVLVIDDLLDEDDETFFVNLSDPVNVTISDNQGQGEIIDNDPTPTLSIEDAQVNEGDDSSTQIDLIVSLSAASGRTVSMDYETADVSATGGSDYKSVPEAVLEFAQGQTEDSIRVTIYSDLLDEDDETFLVNLSNLINVQAGDTQSEIRIIDNDPTPDLLIEDVQVNEGDVGSVLIDVTVSLSAASGRTVSVNYATEDGSAEAGNDYETISESTLEFAEGQSARVVTVTIYSDVLDEDDETFFLNFTNPVNALLDDMQIDIQIIDDDNILYGDIDQNGIIELEDVEIALDEILTFGEQLSGAAFLAADIDGDLEITAVDLILLINLLPDSR
ncbi:MAG: hypothetical protein B6244_02230 [Candidatus Cloacimonetes bacterium 4572_55]|nr:MAG: hypothetical protein B6244_02230 [Candidatus Cloacimonetes bacterium 4572_55]